MTSGNLTLRKATVIRIDRIVPHDPKILNIVGGKWDGVYDVVFAASSIWKSKAGIENPDATVGFMLELLAASAINRPSQSIALFFDTNLYYFCTSNDIYGRNSRSAPPKAVRNDRLIKFAYREDNQHHISLVSDLLSNWSLLKH